MNIPILNSYGERLDTTLHPGSSPGPVLVILGHGVTGNKDRPFLVALAEAIAAAGIDALRISFSGNGGSEGRFIDATITKEAADLGCVIDAFPGRYIVYIGHSMGGAVGLQRTSRDPRIRRLVSLAGMVNTRAFAEREFGSVVPGQGCMWDEPACPLSHAYMEDLRGIDSLRGCAPQVRVPWLLVHGLEDDVIPVADSREVFALANPPKELIELPGANHVFAGEACGQMIKAVVPWLIAAR